jgi:hypothetical protein
VRKIIAQKGIAWRGKDKQKNIAFLHEILNKLMPYDFKLIKNKALLVF